MATARQFFEKLRGNRDVFRRLFLGPDGNLTNDAVLFFREMRRFCYGNKPTIKGKDKVDPFASVAAAARQEVFFRMLDTIHLSEGQINLMERLAHERGNADG